MEQSFYTVEHGDQLYRILQEHYGPQSFFENREDILSAFRQNNPHVSNIDLIFPGQTFVLADSKRGGLILPATLDKASCAAVPAISAELSSASPQVRQAWSHLTAERVASDVGTSYVNYIKSQSKVSLDAIKKVSSNYENKLSASITKGQYDGRRIKLMTEYDRSLGAMKPLHRPLSSSRAVLHIKPQASIPTQSLLTETQTVKRYLSTASKGVVVLQIADLAQFGTEVATAPSGSHQADLAMRKGSSMLGAYVGGAMGGLIFGALISNPVGWVAIAGIVLSGTAAIGGSIAAEELGSRVSQELFFDEKGRPLVKDPIRGLQFR